VGRGGEKRVAPRLTFSPARRGRRTAGGRRAEGAVVVRVQRSAAHGVAVLWPNCIGELQAGSRPPACCRCDALRSLSPSLSPFTYPPPLPLLSATAAPHRAVL